MNKTIESKVSETVLQEPLHVTVGNKLYKVAPPSVGTLIEVSSLISKLPEIEIKGENIVLESLMIAKNCGILGQIASTLILGARPNSFTHLIKISFLKRLKIGKTKYEKLSEKILCECSPKDISTIISSILSRMEIADFFGLTTSLLDVNLLRRTKGEVD